MAMFRSKLVYEHIPGIPSCHCSNLIALPDNTIRIAFFAGQFEKSPDVAIWGAELQRDNPALTWSNPHILVDVPNQSMGSPVWYLTPEKRLYLFYLVMHHGKILPAGWSVCNIRYRISEDLGKTWGPEKYLRKMWFWVTRALPEVNAIGEVILPVHRELGQYQSMFFVNSKTDLTGTWKRYGRLKTPKGNLEPCITKLATGELLCAMRTKDKRIYFSRSADHGHTWSIPVASEFPNPNSQVYLKALRSGRVILIFNATEKGRSPLALASSNDNGHTWTNPIFLENEPGQEFSYPSIIQTDDGLIHVSYTYKRSSIKYAVFDEEWINKKLSDGA
jgi:predicted neuraminidase